jgi:xylan 1,4-beta-xylosidase
MTGRRSIGPCFSVRISFKNAMKTLAVLISALLPLLAQETVKIRVDAAAETGPLCPIWAFFGYDEPNYTYMKDGRKLLSELAQASPVTLHVRAHNLLTTGDGAAALK